MGKDMQEIRKTVGIVMPLGSQQGGAEALLRHLLRHGSERFRFVLVFFEEGTMVEEARRLGYDTLVIPATHLSSAGNYWKSALALRRWVRTRGIDLVFSWMPKAHLYAGPATFGLKTKKIWYQHGVPERDPLDRIATFLSADAVFCCSKTSLAHQERLSPKRRAMVSYPGISGTEGKGASKAEAREQLGLPQSAPIICMVARLERWKGAHIFVAAADRIFASFPDAILAVIGGAHPADPGYAAELKESIGSLSRPEQFLLVGQKSMEEVPMWQSAADLIVHPVTGVEAFGMAVPEAMAMGKVVIASNEGGPGEVIEDGISGVLVKKGDAENLAQVAIDLLLNPKRCELLEAGALRRAQEFSVSRFAHRLDELFATVLGSETDR